MMARHNGFTVIEGLLIIVVVGIIGAVGYMGYTNFIAPKTPATVSSSSSEPVNVESKADLDDASTQLDNVSLDDSDSGQFDSAAGSF